jgi:hypothetical protein
MGAHHKAQKQQADSHAGRHEGTPGPARVRLDLVFAQSRHPETSHNAAKNMPITSRAMLPKYYFSRLNLSNARHGGAFRVQPHPAKVTCRRAADRNNHRMTHHQWLLFLPAAMLVAASPGGATFWP